MLGTVSGVFGEGVVSGPVPSPEILFCGLAVGKVPGTFWEGVIPCRIPSPVIANQSAAATKVPGLCDTFPGLRRQA